MRTENIAYSLQ